MPSLNRYQKYHFIELKCLLNIDISTLHSTKITILKMISLIFILICSHSSEIVHVRTQICDRNTQIWWRRRDVAITSQCAEASFSLAGEDEVECIEVAETFKYLGRMFERSDDDWPEVHQDPGKAH